MVHKLKTIRGDMLVLQCQLERELIRYVRRYLCPVSYTHLDVYKRQIQMCGFPANHLETYVNMLLDRGFDVVVSSLETGERSTRNIVSTNKEDPVQRCV